MPVLPHLSTGQLVTATHHNDIVDAINGVTGNNYLLNLTAFGTHLLNAAGVGAQGLQVRNFSAGVGNHARIDVTGDAHSLSLVQLSSTYTSSGYLASDGGIVAADGIGGLTLVALNGHIRFFGVSGTTERMRLSTSGTLMLTATSSMAASSYQTSTGLMINQGALSDEAVCLKSSAVSHGMTSVSDANTYGTMAMITATDGGVAINGYTESAMATMVRGFATTNDTTRSTGSASAVVIHGYKKVGTTFGTLGGNSNVLAVGDNNVVRFILDSDGDSHQDVGTAWTNFDDHEDVELLHALSVGVSRQDDPLRQAFGAFLEKHRPTLEGQRIVTFNEDGHHFINWSRTSMLLIGAVRQAGQKIAALETTVSDLTRRLEA